MVMDQNFYVADITATWIDYPNPTDIAVIVYFEGCSHNCLDCQNPQNQIRHAENRVQFSDLIVSIIQAGKAWRTDKVVLSGGDPFYHTDIKDFQAMALLISHLENLGYKVCVYTGYSCFEILKFYGELDKLPNEGRWDDSSHEWLTYKTIYGKPSWIKTGTYHKSEFNPDPGKTKTTLTLASKNQAFFERTSPLNTTEYNYVNRTTEGVLTF